MPVSSYLLEGEISYETVAPVLRWLDTQTPKHLGISSTGGNLGQALFLAEAVNCHIDGDIEVVVAGYCYSAAFAMMMSLFSSVTVSVCPGALGMLHYASVDVTMTMTTAPKAPSMGEITAHKSSLEDVKKWMDEWAKHNLTVAERRKLRQGHDVYFSYKRLKELFKR